MDPHKTRQLHELRDRLERSKWDRLTDLTSRGMLQLIPGGALFDAWTSGYEETKELEEALTLIISSLQEITDEHPSGEQLRILDRSLSHYLMTFERVFLSQFEISNTLHTEILGVLRDAFPPGRISSPLLILVSGPSASGKDAILQSVVMRLRARGVDCDHLLKYTTRSRRQGEVESVYYLPYQKYLSEADFDSLEAQGEIILSYRKYGNRYGFSKSSLAESGSHNVPCFCILSHFPHVAEAVPNLRRDGIRILPVLVNAPPEVCRRRMHNRNLPPREVQTRLAEMEADCSYISSNEKTISALYSLQIHNDDDQGFNKACTQLYRFVWDTLRNAWAPLSQG